MLQSKTACHCFIGNITYFFIGWKNAFEIPTIIKIFFLLLKKDLSQMVPCMYDCWFVKNKQSLMVALLSYIY